MNRLTFKLKSLIMAQIDAGGMLNTCKSNGSIESLLSDGEWRTGE